MAAIGEIRKHYGLLVIIIGVALLAFIMGDVFKSRSREAVNIGEVAGEEISYKDFSTQVEKAVEAEKTNNNKLQLTAAETYRIKQSTWNRMVRNIVMDKELETLGLGVPPQELFELVQGEKPHRYILQSFSDPATGEYKRELVLQYLQNLDQMPRAKQMQWIDFENAIKEDQLNTAFTNLISKAYYVPEAFAKMLQQRDAKQVKGEVMAQLYSSVADDKVTVSEQDYQTYYDAHKVDFKQEASRNIDYVVFNVRPSADDKQEQRRSFDEYVAEMKTLKVEQVPAFVNSISDDKYQDRWYKKTELPLQIADAMFAGKVGDIVPTYESNGAYQTAELIAKALRPDSLKASHVLVAYAGANQAAQEITRTKEEAKAIADSLMQVIKKKPAAIEEIAIAYSDDGAVANNKGHYDWFADGRMVPEFNEAVVENKKGAVVMAETVYGFHVIRVDGKKDMSERVKVARVRRVINPSNQTFQQVYVKANEFASKCKDNDFAKVAEEMKLSTRVFENVGAMQENLPGQKEGRQIIIWAFGEERQQGDHNLFDMGNSYMVANLSKITEEGYATLQDVKQRIAQAVKNSKKADYIITQIDNSSAKGDIQALANELNTAVEQANFSYASNNIPGVGPEPEVVAAALGLKQGEVSKAIKGSRAVFVVKAQEVAAAPAAQDAAAVAKNMKNQFASGINYYLFKSLEKQADVVDNRYVFY